MAIAILRRIPSRVHINDEFARGRRLRKTAAIYRRLGKKYALGQLTAKYYNLKGQDEKDWSAAILEYEDIAGPIKAVIVHALSHTPPIPIHWDWHPKGPKFVQVKYEPKPPHYRLLISGYNALRSKK